eukprot:gene13125-8971_t
MRAHQNLPKTTPSHTHNQKLYKQFHNHRTRFNSGNSQTPAIRQHATQPNPQNPATRSTQHVSTKALNPKIRIRNTNLKTWKARTDHLHATLSYQVSNIVHNIVPTPRNRQVCPLPLTATLLCYNSTTASPQALQKQPTIRQTSQCTQALPPKHTSAAKHNQTHKVARKHICGTNPTQQQCKQHNYPPQTHSHMVCPVHHKAITLLQNPQPRSPKIQRPESPNPPHPSGSHPGIRNHHNCIYPTKSNHTFPPEIRLGNKYHQVPKLVVTTNLTTTHPQNTTKTHLHALKPRKPSRAKPTSKKQTLECPSEIHTVNKYTVNNNILPNAAPKNPKIQYLGAHNRATPKVISHTIGMHLDNKFTTKFLNLRNHLSHNCHAQETIPGKFASQDAQNPLLWDPRLEPHPSHTQLSHCLRQIRHPEIRRHRKPALKLKPNTSFGWQSHNQRKSKLWRRNKTQNPWPLPTTETISQNSHYTSSQKAKQQHVNTKINQHSKHSNHKRLSLHNLRTTISVRNTTIKQKPETQPQFNETSVLMKYRTVTQSKTHKNKPSNNAETNSVKQSNHLSKYPHPRKPESRTPTSKGKASTVSNKPPAQCLPACLNVKVNTLTSVIHKQTDHPQTESSNPKKHRATKCNCQCQTHVATNQTI